MRSKILVIVLEMLSVEKSAAFLAQLVTMINNLEHDVIMNKVFSKRFYICLIFMNNILHAFLLVHVWWMKNLCTTCGSRWQFGFKQSISQFSYYWFLWWGLSFPWTCVKERHSSGHSQEDFILPGPLRSWWTQPSPLRLLWTRFYTSWPNIIIVNNI